MESKEKNKTKQDAKQGRQENGEKHAKDKRENADRASRKEAFGNKKEHI